MFDYRDSLFNPYGLSNLSGMRIVESPDRPKYTLPEEVIPGVPWPPGFRDEINRWSVSFLGTTNVVPPGVAFVLANGLTIMRPKDAAALKINTMC